MADQMQAIKRRMKSVSSTERITNAMKLVSAAKLKQATNRFDYIRKHLEEEKRLYGQVLRTEEGVPDVYLEPRDGETLYLLLTSSKGLCGSYNTSITKAAGQIAEEEKGSCCFAALGTKGKEFCLREGLEMLETEREQMDEMGYEEAYRLAGEVLELYREGRFTSIRVLYASYLNSISHEVKAAPVFPLEAGGQAGDCDLTLMEYEPAGRELFDSLAQEYLALYLYSAIAEATLCEHSARRIAMKNASDSANEMLTELSIYYNRARQAAITSEIIEIIAGSEAQKLRGEAIE